MSFSFQRNRFAQKTLKEVLQYLVLIFKKCVMEIKKSKRANLEKSRGTFLLLGLIVTLGFVWMSFEYKSYDKYSEMDSVNFMSVEDDVMIIQTKAPEKIKPPKVVAMKIEVVIDKTPDIPDFDFTVETGEDDIIDEPILDEGDDDDGDFEPVIFVPVEDQPSFPGGEQALLKYLSQIKYPEMAKEGSVQGTVYITFVVEKDGSVSGVKLLRGIGSGCDEESLKIVKKMPKWSPGEQRGRPVRVRMNVPIKFVLAH